MGFVVAAIVLFILFKVWRYRRRRKKLFKKYGDMQVVRGIMSHSIWEGQTAPQLLDSIGKPVAMDRSVYKSVGKDVWKYAQSGKNRYALRVTVEEGRVTGWENKSA